MKVFISQLFKLRLNVSVQYIYIFINKDTLCKIKHLSDAIYAVLASTLMLIFYYKHKQRSELYGQPVQYTFSYYINPTALLTLS